MSRTIHRLKPLTVERAKNPGRYADGGGLYLVVKPGPRKSWAFIYRRDTKMTELGLGGANAVLLSDARAEAAELRGVMATGGDPKCLIPGFDGAFFSPAWKGRTMGQVLHGCATTTEAVRRARDCQNFCVRQLSVMRARSAL